MIILLYVRLIVRGGVRMTISNECKMLKLGCYKNEDYISCASNDHSEVNPDN